MSKDPTSLSDLKAKEVSLVKRGANKKRRFPVFKQETSMSMDPEMIEILKSLLREEIEDESKLLEWTEKQKMGEKEANALKGAMRILGGFKENPQIKKVLDAIAGMVGYAEPQKMEPGEKKPGYKEPETMKKDDAADDKIPEAIQKQLDDANERAEKFEKALEDERRARRRQELVVKCRDDYALVPGLSDEEKADLLLDATDEARERIEKQWAATQGAMASSKLLKSIGRTGAMSDPAPDTAAGKLDAIAKQIVEKSGSEMTREQAFAKAMDQNPELYAEYLSENKQQVQATDL